MQHAACSGVERERANIDSGQRSDAQGEAVRQLIRHMVRGLAHAKRVQLRPRSCPDGRVAFSRPSAFIAARSPSRRLTPCPSTCQYCSPHRLEQLLILSAALPGAGPTDGPHKVATTLGLAL